MRGPYTSSPTTCPRCTSTVLRCSRRPAAEASATFDRLLSVARLPRRASTAVLASSRRERSAFAAEALGEASRLVEPDARLRLAEQGLRGAALDDAVLKATIVARADAGRPAFSRWANDPGFRLAPGGR